jgi:hypothetical protein
LIRRYLGLSIVLAFMFIGFSMAQTEENATANLTAENATVTEPEALNLEYIWSLTMGDEQITMVLHQDAGDLFGQAKFEGEKPWNGLVAGSISGDQVWLVMTAMKGDSLEATKLTGTYAAETISGTYTKYDSSGKTGSGEFSAIWINPDTSAYTPAVISETTPAAPANVTAPAETEETKTAATGASRFVDVRKYKDQIGPAGVIPPGMGGGLE